MTEEKTKTLHASDMSFAGDIASAPTIYVDGAQGFMASGSVIKINLFDVVQDLSEPDGLRSLRKVIAARLVMPPDVARQVATWLLEQLDAATEDTTNSDG